MDDYFDIDIWSYLANSIRKLPHQVDNSKLEISLLNVLGMNSMGVFITEGVIGTELVVIHHPNLSGLLSLSN